MIQSQVLFLGILSGVIQFLGYSIYTYHVRRDKVKPNPASWLIWSYGNILVCLSYIFLVDKSLTFATEILPIVCSVTCVLMTFYFLYIGKFRKITSFEKKIVAFDIIITLIWVFSELGFVSFVSINLIHLTLLFSAVISFIPVYKDVLDEPGSEHPTPWVVWTVAYTLLAVIVFVEGGDVYSFSYPILYLLLHLIVAVLAYRKKL